MIRSEFFIYAFHVSCAPTIYSFFFDGVPNLKTCAPHILPSSLTTIPPLPLTDFLIPAMDLWSVGGFMLQKT